MSVGASLEEESATYPVKLTAVECNCRAFDDERSVDDRDERPSPVEVVH